jgi:hypothetical protein
MIVSLQFGITPDMRLLAQKLGNAHFQSAMKIGNPTLLPLDQLNVVKVRVADKGVAFKIHSRPLAFVRAGI